MRFFWRSRMLSMSSRVFWNTFCGKSPSRKTFGMALYQRRRKKHKTCGRQGGSRIEDIRDGVVLEKKKETQDVWQVGCEQDRRHSGWRCTRAEGRNTRRVAGRVGVGQKTFGMALYQSRRKKHKTCGRQGGCRIEDIRDGVVLEKKKETQDVWQVGWKQDRRYSKWHCTRAEGRNTRPKNVWQIGWEQDRRHSGWRCTRAEGRNTRPKNVWQIGWEQDRRHSEWRCARAEGRNTRRVAGRIGVGQKTSGMALYQSRRKKHKTCGRQGGSKIEDIRDGVVLEKKKETQDVWQVGWEQDRRHSGWRCTRAEGRNTRRVAGRVGVGQKTFGMALYQRRRKKHKTCGRQGGSRIEDIRDGVVLEKKKETQDVWQVGCEKHKTKKRMADRMGVGQKTFGVALYQSRRKKHKTKKRMADRMGVGQKTFGMALYQSRRKKHKTCGRQGGSRIEDIRDGVVLEKKKETQDVWQVGWEQDRSHPGWRCTRAEGRNTRRVAGRMGVGQKTFGMALYQSRRKKHKTCGRWDRSRIEDIRVGMILAQKEETKDLWQV